ncbi:MAG: hypothetical protein LHW46_08790 [Candidatus Cloacimonetes bacterium]|nr:hypothetical protein [Candidatus Cloacimonadota bacterium]
MYTKKIFAREDRMYIGDLGRMSYQLDTFHPKKFTLTLKKKHFNLKNWKGEQIDIVTIGDSFFNAGAGGVNPYFQDHIATLYNKNVLNLKKSTSSSLQTIINLYNSGWLQQIQPKYIILEIVARDAVQSFAINLNWNSNEPFQDSFLAHQETQDPFIPKTKFINTANYKYLYFNLFPNKNKYVYTFQLKQNLFSARTANKLLVYHNDIKNLQNINEKNISLLNDNLNKLSSILQQSNIQLIFLPAVDKYDLYHKYIIDNNYPKNDFFTLLEKEKKEYIYINSKSILTSALDENTNDIFYADDTHWSNVASELICKNKLFANSFSKEIF